MVSLFLIYFVLGLKQENTHQFSTFGAYRKTEKWNIDLFSLYLFGSLNGIIEWSADVRLQVEITLKKQILSGGENSIEHC